MWHTNGCDDAARFTTDRSKEGMVGISICGSLNRADWRLGAPVGSPTLDIHGRD